MSGGYKEIKIPTNSTREVVVEVNLEDVTDFDEHEAEIDMNKGTKEFKPVQQKPQQKTATVTFADDDEGDTDGTDEDSGVEADDEQEVHNTQNTVQPNGRAGVPKKRKSRANERIRELNTQKNDLREQLENERRERMQLQAQLLQGNKTSKESMKGSLAQQETLLTNQLKEAIRNGEADLVVDLQSQIWDVKAQLAGITHELAKMPEKIEPAQNEAPQRKINRKATAWVEDHPEFKTDEVFHAAAMAINNRLVAEGWDSDSDDFYSELESRLAPRFPEVFGTKEENDVEYETEQNTSSSRKPDVTKVAKSQSFQQTVAGASRNPVSSVPGARKSSKNSVTLTSQEIAQAEQWGWTLERMAKRKLHMEKNRKDDGYVPILMDTTK